MLCGLPIGVDLKKKLHETISKKYFLDFKNRVKLNKTVFYVETMPYEISNVKGKLAFCFNERKSRDLKESRYDEIVNAIELLEENKEIKHELKEFFDKKNKLLMNKVRDAEKLDGYSAIFTTDFSLTKKAVNKKTKAIMLVTINGRYPDMEQFVKFAKLKNIFLIEDAAQSLGSFYKSKHLGTFGDIGIFSFSAPKVITMGQGGCLITNNEALYKKILMVKDFGRAKSGVDYHEQMGLNLKFNDVQAVIGVEQMRKLPWRVKRKKEMYRLYKSLLREIKEVEFIETDLENTSPWFIDVLVPSQKREELIIFLEARGIGSRVFYPAIHTQPPYAWIKERFKNADHVSARGLWLPSSSFLSDEDIAHVCATIKEFFV